MSRQKEKTEYRRGILLGLTMAEIFIVMLFLLLLAFVSLMEAKDKEYAALNEKYKNVAGAAPDKTVEKIKNIVLGKPPEITDELVNVLEMVPKWIEKIDLNKLKKDPSESVNDVISRVLEQAKPVDTSKEPPCEAELSKAREQLKELQAQTDILKAQQQNYITQVNNKSLEPPPCWPDAEGRWSDSIFKIDLTDKGITAYDATPQQWEDAKSKLPLQRVKYGALRSPSDFLADTVDVYEWSRKQNCRFLVQVADKTGDHEKINYKRLYNTVKGHFIIQDLRGTSSGNSKNKAPVENTKPSFFDSIFRPQKSQQRSKYNEN